MAHGYGQIWYRQLGETNCACLSLARDENFIDSCKENERNIFLYMPNMESNRNTQFGFLSFFLCIGEQ